MQSNKDTFMHNPFLNPVDYSLFPNIRKDRHSKKKTLRNIRNWHKPGSTDKTCLKRDFSITFGSKTHLYVRNVLQEDYKPASRIRNAFTMNKRRSSTVCIRKATSLNLLEIDER